MLRGLATLVMRGRGQAILAVAVAAVLSVLLPPLSWVSAAALALVTLRRGPGEGAVVLAGSLIAGGVLAFVTVGTPLPAASFLGVLWLPTWLVATVLRATVSLAFALEAAGLLAIAVVLGFHVALGEPAAWWSETLDTVLVPMFANADAEQLERLRQSIGLVAGYMTGLSVAAGLVNLLLGLLLARSWQAALYNPGGFQREFHALRLHPPAAAVAALLFALALLAGASPGLATDVAAVALVPAALAGAAVIHALVKTRGGGKVGWLVALYALLLLALPQTVAALALLGLANGWLDLGRRLGKPPASPGSDSDGND